MGATDILIISDDARLCKSLTALLSAEGCSVARASGLAEGVETARRQLPGLILLDLPGSPAGWGIPIGKLQRVRDIRHVPVIALTDVPVADDELLTVFDVLPKPVDPARLREDLALVGRRRAKHFAPPGHLVDEEHRLFADYLETGTGLHFDQRNLKLLERGLRSRMTALKLGSYTDYFDYLVRHGETRGELAKLLIYLTVGETSFFRYPYHFDALRRIVLPEITARQVKGERRIRIWSAGCSTGEEPYSLAITLMEALPDWRRRDIRILATDLNAQSLRRAREGFYSARALRGTDRECLARHFTAKENGWLVRDDVRRLVDFGFLNLKAGRFPSPDGEEAGFDVIFCRNVMIYFELATMERLVARFAESLAPGGYLFLGHAESLLQLSSRFERLSHGGGFFYRRRDGHAAPRQRARASAPVPHLPFPPRPAAAPRKALTPVPDAATPSVRRMPLPPAPATGAAIAEPPPRDLFQEARELFDTEDYGGAAALLGELLAQEPGHIGALLTMGTILANNGRLDEALSACTSVLAVDDLVPEAYFLRGLILETGERTEEAVEEYRKAVLLDMDAVMPHYSLGQLYRRLGKSRDGARELRNALRALEKLPEGKVVPFSGGLSREAFRELLSAELARY